MEAGTHINISTIDYQVINNVSLAVVSCYAQWVTATRKCLVSNGLVLKTENTPTKPRQNSTYTKN